MLILNCTVLYCTVLRKSMVMYCHSLFVVFWFDFCEQIKGGIDSTFADAKKAPDTYVWGEAKRIHKANAIAIRGDMHANERDVVDLDLRINNSFRNALGLRVLGSAGRLLP